MAISIGIKNIDASPLSFTQLNVPGGSLAPLTTVTVTDYNSRDEIISDTELLSYIEADKAVFVIDTGSGAVEYTSAQSKQVINLGYFQHHILHEYGGLDELNVAGLSGVLADDQNPVAHASDHENGGSDEISVAGLSGVLADAQNADKIQGRDISTAVPTNDQVLLWNGTNSNWEPSAVPGVGGHWYPPSAIDPVSPVPNDGDFYYNTALNKLMMYDDSRSKWLSMEIESFQFGKRGNISAGSYYRSPGNISMSSDRGYTAPWNGTVVAIAYTRSDTDSATFEVVSNGANLAELSSAAVKGKDVTINADFSVDDVLAVKNKSGGSTVSNAQGWVFMRFRV